MKINFISLLYIKFVAVFFFWNLLLSNLLRLRFFFLNCQSHLLLWSQLSASWQPHYCEKNESVTLWKMERIYFPLNLQILPSANSWSTVKGEEGQILGAFTLWKRVFLLRILFLFGFFVVTEDFFLRQKQSTKLLCFSESVITVGFWWWLHFFHPNNVPKQKLPLKYSLFLGCT